MNSSRRKFFKKILGSAFILSTLPKITFSQQKRGGPVAVSSGNGLRATEKAMELLRAGVDPLDAAIAGVNIVEDDPNDITVGLGGLPNEEGIVELDASVMHGPTHDAGAVASLRGIRNPSKVAKLVMTRSDHVLLVGEGALKFAKAHGFKEEDLLTEKARKIWLYWKETLSDKDDWFPPKDEEIEEEIRNYFRTHGTITCLALDAKGDLGGVTTTSGLAFKIPGRVGDSPIIGAGLYVDNDVGAAGSTGRGEANILNVGAHTVVELMRLGKTPEEACLETLERVVYTNKKQGYLHDEKGRPKFNLNFYAVRKDGLFGAASIWSGSKYAVNDGKTNKLLDCAYLFKRER